jgi:hypothetical protein
MQLRKRTSFFCAVLVLIISVTMFFLRAEVSQALPRKMIEYNPPIDGGGGQFSTPTPTPTPSLAGTLPGTFEVNETGAGVYTIPIQIPPGSAGVQPGLSLSYNSQAGDDLLGMGWNLTGISAITRCAADIMHDGINGAVAYNTNDRFCLDGKRLVAIVGADGGNGTEYRTDPDEFSHIVSYGSAGSGPAYFEVRTKDGLIYEYGGDSTRTEGRIEAEGRTDGSVRVWAVNLIQNRKSSYFDFTYFEDPTTHEYSPYEIHYTGNFGQSKPTYNKVQFAYETRPDVITRYDGGSLIQVSKRISSIKTFAANPTSTMVHDYRLTYQTGAATQRSILSSIQQCGPNNVCLPATVFVWTGPTSATQATVGPVEWGSGGFGGTKHIKDKWAMTGVSASCCSPAIGVNAGLSNSKKGDNASIGFQAGATFAVNFHRSEYDIPQDILGDFNGDGKQDVVQIQGSSGRAFVWLSDGSSFVNIGTEANPSGTGFDEDEAVAEVRVADFNGDGKDDLAWFPDHTDDGVGGGPAYVWISNFTSTGGTFSSRQDWGGGFHDPSKTVIGDFNGDGKADAAEIFDDEGRIAFDGFELYYTRPLAELFRNFKSEAWRL